MRNTATNNGFTVVTSIRIPLADVAKLKAVCAERGIPKAAVLLAGMRAEIERLRSQEPRQTAGETLRN